MIISSIWLIKTKCYIFWQIIIIQNSILLEIYFSMIQIYFSMQIIATQNNILLEIYFSMIQLQCSLIWSSDPGGTMYLSQPALPSGEGESEEGGREGVQQHISITGVTDRPGLRGCTGKPKIRKLVLSKCWCPHSSWQVHRHPGNARRFAAGQCRSHRGLFGLCPMPSDADIWCIGWMCVWRWVGHECGIWGVC